MKKVYVASAISAENLEKGLGNLRKGILAGVELLKKGYAPYVPHLDYQFNLIQDEHIDVDLYYKYDLKWLRQQLFNRYWDALPKDEQTDEVAENIAYLINSATLASTIDKISNIFFYLS